MNFIVHYSTLKVFRFETDNMVHNIVQFQVTWKATKASELDVTMCKLSPLSHSRLNICLILSYSFMLSFLYRVFCNDVVSTSVVQTVQISVVGR